MFAEDQPLEPMILTSILGLEQTAKMSPQEFAQIEDIVNREINSNPAIDAELSRNPVILKELASAIGKAVKAQPKRR
jgi:hypothetical protein